ncbi:hypothetical protein HanRHA438_Chr14g0662251 [Helianthus annuus]|nr:hypothetical protein HanRHA438_Chr14g0662251 [Helianthus annuus]
MSFVNNPILHSIICLHDHFKTGNFLTKKHSKENQFVSNLSTPIPTIPYKASQRFNLLKIQDHGGAAGAAPERFNKRHTGGWWMR